MMNSRDWCCEEIRTVKREAVCLTLTYRKATKKIMELEIGTSCDRKASRASSSKRFQALTRSARNRWTALSDPVFQFNSVPANQ
jgi:hypothetical protein